MYPPLGILLGTLLLLELTVGMYVPTYEKVLDLVWIELKYNYLQIQILMTL